MVVVVVYLGLRVAVLRYLQLSAGLLGYYLGLPLTLGLLGMLIWVGICGCGINCFMMIWIGRKLGLLMLCGFFCLMWGTCECVVGSCDMVVFVCAIRFWMVMLTSD